MYYKVQEQSAHTLYMYMYYRGVCILEIKINISILISLGTAKAQLYSQY